MTGNVTVQDYADQRYYNANYGRFWTVDPGGLKTADPKDPTSWNRYAYAGDDPVNFIDPRGLQKWAPICWEAPKSGPEGWIPGGSVACDDWGASGGGGPIAGADAGDRKIPTVSNFTTTGKSAAAVQNTISFLDADLDQGNDPDSDCARWLAGSSTLSTFQKSLDLLASTQSMVGVGTFSDNTINAMAMSPASTGIPAGTMVTVNTSGAFFQSGPSESVGYGVPDWIKGGSAAAQMLIVLHELAHVFEAPGFVQNDYGDTAAQKNNNQLVMQNCGSVITWWASRGN